MNDGLMREVAELAKEHHDNCDDCQDYDLMVRAELAAGNWPSCGDCGQPGMLEYLGVLAGCPTFTCRACHALMGVDLPDVPT